ncbi:hypothetical protein NL676_013466 [Syzygium grande]|nr:hypothetical protein NL676_013466 [Syzygium grande]
MLVAIGEMSILYFGVHLWIIQRAVDRISLHLQPNWAMVLLASIIFGMLIYSNVESQIKWLVIWTFPWVVPATDPYLLQVVLDRTSKIWKRLVGASCWAFERSHGKLSQFWIARRTMLSSEREVSVNQEASHGKCNFGDELV